MCIIWKQNLQVYKSKITYYFWPVTNRFTSCALKCNELLGLVTKVCGVVNYCQ